MSTLFDQPQPAYAAFDTEHPDLWESFCRIVAEARAAGFKRWSADGVLHIIRWERRREIVGGKPFAVNNNVSAFLARRWREAHPESAEFFEVRRSKQDQQQAA